jgi:hypothetical protein
VYEKSIKEKEEEKRLKEEEIHKFDATADLFPVKEPQPLKGRTMPKRIRPPVAFSSVNIMR